MFVACARCYIYILSTMNSKVLDGTISIFIGDISYLTYSIKELYIIAHSCAFLLFTNFLIYVFFILYDSIIFK